MFPARVAESFDRIWPVFHWKWELDKGTPWFRVAFFLLCYRPFIHFAWKVFKIPAANGLEVEGKKYRVIWFENAGFFSTEDQADIACTGPWHGYKDAPLDRKFPDESCQYSSLVFPRQKDKRQRREPTFSIIAKDRRQEETEQQLIRKCIKRIDQALD